MSEKTICDECKKEIKYIDKRWDLMTTFRICGFIISRKHKDLCDKCYQKEMSNEK